MAIGEGGNDVQISTKEGGIFNPSPNDEIAVAPNAVSNLKKLSRIQNSGTSEGISNRGGNASNGIDVLVNEMKALRKEFSNKSNNVFLDGQKVTSGIVLSNEQSSRNNFSYGQRK